MFFRVKVDVSANFYGKYSAPSLPADRSFGHAEETVRLERCGFRSRGFRFILSWPEVNQTSRNSSAFLRKNCASFRVAVKVRVSPVALLIVKHHRTARDNRLVTDR